MKFGQNMDVNSSKVDVEGQGHRSKVKVTRSKKGYFRSNLPVLQVIFEVKGHMGQCQKSYGSRSKVDLEGLSQRSRSPSQKCNFRSHLTDLQVMFGVKGHPGQGQRSHGSRSKVTLVMPSLKVTILAGGLTSTSSCICNRTVLTFTVLIILSNSPSSCVCKL